MSEHTPEKPQDQSIIPLAEGLETMIDASDEDSVFQHKWSPVKMRGGRIYAYTLINGKITYLHAFLTGAKKTDHKDRNGLNNRRSNLRPCTNSQNLANRGKTKNNTSGYKGVWDRHNGTFAASIRHMYKTYHLGTYQRAEDAARAYDRKALELFGEFAFLNFSHFDYL
jgi:hypothetical protein